MGIPFEELENIQESIPIGGYVVCTVTIYPEKPQNIKLSCVAKRVKRAGTDITESNVIFKTYDISWPRRK